MEIKWEKAYKVLSQSSLSICWNVNLKCINSHVMSLTLSSFSCLPSALKSQVIYNCSHYVKDIEVSKRCPGNKIVYLLFIFVILSLLLVEGLGSIWTISEEAENYCLMGGPLLREHLQGKGQPSLYTRPTLISFSSFFIYLFNIGCLLLAVKGIADNRDSVLGLWSAGTRSMLRTRSNSWMGSLQVVMTFSHNLCEAQWHASAC